MRSQDSSDRIPDTGFQSLAHLASYTMDTRSHSFGNGKRLVRKVWVFISFLRLQGMALNHGDNITNIITGFMSLKMDLVAYF
jgi:hypothetical protein